MEPLNASWEGADREVEEAWGCDVMAVKAGMARRLSPCKVLQQETEKCLLSLETQRPL